MHYLLLLCLISVGSFVGCAPLNTHDTPNTFYDAILEKCLSVQQLSSYKTQPIFTACKNFKAISAVNTLKDNSKDIRCLLYFVSFTQYCTQTPKANTTFVLTQHSIDEICDYAKTIIHKNLSTIFSKAEDCKKICLDDMGYLDTICSISYYFGQVKPDPVALEQNEPPVPVHNNNQDGKNEHAPEPNTETKIDERKIDERKNNVQDLRAEASTKKKVPGSVPQEEKHPLEASESAVNPDVKTPNAAPALPAGNVAPQETNPAQSPEVAHGVDTPVQAQPEENQNKNPEAKPKGNDVSSPVENEKDPDVLPDESTKYVTPHETHDNANEGEGQIADSNLKAGEVKTVQSSPKEVENDNGEIPVESVGDNMANQNVQVNADLDGGDDDVELPDGTEEENLPAPNPVHADIDSKPLKTDESEPANYGTEMEGDSYFFTYFMLLCIIFIVGYVCYHNKQKILALILEGRRGKRQYRGRRPNSANYHKLDSNLEEAITSSCKKNTNNVIY